MNRSIFAYLAEALDQYYTDRCKTTHTKWLTNKPRRFLHWLMPNGSTLLLVIALIATAQVWARPLASPTAAPGPSATTVNYQGRLANSDGTPLTEDGVAMSFAIYDTKEDGNLIWPPSGSEDHVVDVSDGLFGVGLGSKTSGGIPTTTWNGDRFLEITVGGETLAPRELIRSVPIAGMALTVPNGAIGTDQISSGSISTEHFAQDLVVRLPSTHQVVRDMQTTIPTHPDFITIGDANIELNKPGKIHATCSVTLQPDSTPKQWVSLRIIAQNNNTTVEMDDNVYQGTLSGAYTNISTPGILSLPAGDWIIQCRLNRSTGTDDPTVHTYSITALQIE